MSNNQTSQPLSFEPAPFILQFIWITHLDQYMSPNRFISLFLLLLSTLCSSPALAQSQDPNAILEHSVAAIKEINGFSAQFKMYGEGGSMFADTLPSMSGRLMMGNLEDYGKVIHCLGESRDQKKSNPEAIDILIAKDRFLWTDHTKRTINEAPRKGNNRGAPSALNLVFLDSMILDDPFAKDTLNAQSITLGDQETIAGTLCDVVIIKRATPSKSSRAGTDAYTDVKWFIGTQDKLPRKVERITDAGMLKISLLFELGKIRLSAPPVDQLDITRPSGYEFISHIRKPKTEQTEAAPTRTPRKVTPKAPAAPRARMMPAFTFTTDSGSTIDNASQAGRTTVLYFWGSWCTPCKTASPLVSEMAKEFESKGVDVFGIAIREADPDQIRSDFRREKNNHQLVFDGEHLTSNLRVRVYPTIVIIDNTGEIVFQESIGKDYDSNELVTNAKKAIEESLAEEN